MKVNILLLIFTFYSFSGIIAQIPKNRVDSLKQDFALLRNTFEKKYPSLTRYTSKEEINALFDSCYNSINKSTTKIKFYATIKFILSAIKDGHLYCSIPPDEKSYIKNDAKFTPLILRFTRNHTYVDRSRDVKFPPGSEIIEINHVPIDSIKKKLLKYIVSDGNIQTKKCHILDNFFYFYYFLAYGNEDTFDVKLKLKKGLIISKAFNAVSEKDLIINENRAKSKSLLQFSINQKNIAVLTIKTFDESRLKENNLNFSKFLKTAFKEIHDLKIVKLIIDLRGNSGGRDLYGSLLYSYLTQNPFHYYKSLITATKNLPYNQFIKGASSYNDLSSNMLIKIGQKRFRMRVEAHSNLRPIPPSKNNYTGKIWYLINGLSFSTTAEFCAIAKSNNRGKFIGEETGGTYDGNTSGVMQNVTLPYTKINISYGLVKYEMLVNQTTENGRGVIPDYEVQPSINDILKNRDIQMNYAIKLAREK